MKVKIIFPSGKKLISQRLRSIPGAPLSLEYLASFFSDDDQIDLVDMGYGDEPGFQDEVDLVAIHIRTPVASTAFKIADRFRAAGKKVIMGGPHPTLMPLDCLDHADAICIGEGEQTLPALIGDFIRGQLKMIYIGGPYDTKDLPGEFLHFPDQSDLRGLPSPRRNLFPEKRYHLKGVMVSRGCPYKCRFCAVRKFQGAAVRLRPIEEVISELRAIDGPIFFAEENFLGYPSQTGYYLRLFESMAALPRQNNWSGSGNLAILRSEKGKEVLRAASEAGLNFCAVGIETISPETAVKYRLMEKLGFAESGSFSLSRLQDSINLLYDHGVYVSGFFVIGFDEDTEDTYREILDFCDKTMILPQFSVLSPFPGSELFEVYSKQGRFTEGMNWDDFGSGQLTFKHPRFSKEKLEDIYNKLWGEAYSPDRMMARMDFVKKQMPSAERILAGFQKNVVEAFKPVKESHYSDRV